MKIALVSEHASPLAALGGVDAGGQNVHVAALATHLAATGATVTIFTRRDDVGLPRRVAMASGVEVVHIDAGPADCLAKDDLWPYMSDFADGLARQWAIDRPDLVHAHFWMSAWASAHAAERFDIPLAITFHALGAVKQRHQGSADTSAPERVAVERELANDADLVIATCSDEVRELDAMGAADANVRVVSCGVDVRAFTPIGRVEQRTATPRIVSVSRLVPRKGVEDVVRALVEVPEAELIIAGGPLPERLDTDPEVLHLRSVAEVLGVGNRVEFRSQVSRTDLPALFRSADVAVCAPWYEPFGIVPVEAMACGVPVVASAVGGMLDTVVDGRTGVLVPPRDPSAIARALRELLADEPGRRRMARAAAARGRQYDWTRIAWRTRAAYAELFDTPTTAVAVAVAVRDEVMEEVL